MTETDDLHKVTANNRLMNATELSFAHSDHFIDVFTHYMTQCTENMESHCLGNPGSHLIGGVRVEIRGRYPSFGQS